MGKILEEKALEEDRYLEEEILMFNGEEENSVKFNSIDGEDFVNDEESDSSGSIDPADRVMYWESQKTILQEILAHNSLTGTKLRREVKKAMEMVRETTLCCCCFPKPSFKKCTGCLRRSIVNHLCDKGFNAAICLSKWKSSHKIPGGMHEYVDVIMKGPGRKDTRFLIELEFQAEFEMAKACDGYRKLIEELPEVYIGKPEHLNAVIRIICGAAKKSTKENKIYMGPWRKRRFMQMKWSGSYQRCSSDRSISSTQMHFPTVPFLPASTTVEVV